MYMRTRVWVSQPYFGAVFSLGLKDALTEGLEVTAHLCVVAQHYLTPRHQGVVERHPAVRTVYNEASDHAYKFTCARAVTAGT